MLSSDENHEYHSINCGIEVLPQERLSIFGRSKSDLNGVISQRLGAVY